ncbi:hypothetical protein E2C01_068577 [Portunus trituberculatus]|uniref:Uncharacterized protein n=1 Tax=Portunus trituberculatus TaxID=210409 RepID=A0A5B7I0G3_PORTR|nr:hypothetical protein [Portunus trituberculatus]
MSTAGPQVEYRERHAGSLEATARLNSDRHDRERVRKQGRHPWRESDALRAKDGKTAACACVKDNSHNT